MPKDDSQAIQWYRKATQNATAELRVASMLLEGEGGVSDPGGARQLCQQAAEERYSPGTACMGLIYERGLGVSPDPAEAAKWCKRAAEGLHPTAMLYLGELYWKGNGVKQDKRMAYQFIYLAARGNLSQAVQDKVQLEKEMGSKDIEEAQKKATQWVRQHPHWD